ncbi:hypothetical protein [Dawidia soli]|uniref:Uncharacterized protein n=1 Tax=Dawidia soli TaxID=2782352 RepID=A0AAP2DF37_9BACT|nr:hypothetical protein [Dawidia soli]MBT1689625.1 hypothetical protein [Dawidia soli]
MKKKDSLLIVFVGLMLLHTDLLGQNVLGGAQASGMDMNTGPYGTIKSFGFPEKVTTGSKYLYKNWKIGTLEVDAGSVKEYGMNIDLQNGYVEISTDIGIRTVPMKAIKTLTVGHANTRDLQTFVSTQKYGGTQVGAAGLFEVLVQNDTETTLLKYNFVEVKQASYNAALDMGNNEIKYVIKEKYFLSKNGKLVEVSPNKKKFLESFTGENRTQIENFLKEHNVKLKDQEGIVLVCNFLNDRDIALN